MGSCFSLDIGTGECIFMGLLALLFILSMLTQVYGLYVSFCKKWYFGVAALLVPGFAFIVGIFKIFKKDILA